MADLDIRCLFCADLVCQLVLPQADLYFDRAALGLILNLITGLVTFFIDLIHHEGNIIEQSVVGIVFLPFLCLIIQCFHICIIFIAVCISCYTSYHQCRIIRHGVRLLQNSLNVYVFVRIGILSPNGRFFLFCLNFRSAFCPISDRQRILTFRRYFLCLSILGSFFLFLISFHFFLRRFYLISSICRHVCWRRLYCILLILFWAGCILLSGSCLGNIILFLRFRYFFRCSICRLFYCRLLRSAVCDCLSGIGNAVRAEQHRSNKYSCKKSSHLTHVTLPLVWTRALEGEFPSPFTAVCRILYRQQQENQ